MSYVRAFLFHTGSMADIISFFMQMACRLTIYLQKKNIIVKRIISNQLTWEKLLELT